MKQNIFKKNFFIFITTFLLLTLIGCGDSSSSNDTLVDSTAPVFTSASTLSVTENQIEVLILKAIDDSTVTYNITGADANSFNLDSSSGVVTFKEAPNYESKTSYTFSATATDTFGNESIQDIIVNITNIVGDEPFVTVWEVTGEDLNVTILTDEDYSYNYKIDWGDGTNDINLDTNITHTYENEGNYTVEITGIFPHFWTISFERTWTDPNHNKEYKFPLLLDNAKKNALKLKKVLSFGDIEWKSMKYMFTECAYMEFETTSIPILSNVTSMRGMFYNADAFNQNISLWDVSNVTDMGMMFDYADSFNQDISMWDVSNVTDMYEMFMEANLFNQDISSWNVSNVIDMESMLSCDSFNQDISMWDVSNVKYMYAMFGGNSSFNQDISSWNVANVTDMYAMFAYASTFNQDISSWNVSNVINMGETFVGASSFNQDISMWDVTNVRRMDRMFYGANTFKDKDLSNWTVVNVTDHEDFAIESGGNITEPNWP